MRNRFFLDDEARRPIQGIPDHRIGLTDGARHDRRAPSGTTHRCSTPVRRAMRFSDIEKPGIAER
jgi:hypothetical protein